MSRTGLWKGRSSVRALLRCSDHSRRVCEWLPQRRFAQIQLAEVEQHHHSHAIHTPEWPECVEAGKVSCEDIERLFCSHHLPLSCLSRRQYKDTTVVQIRECPFCHPIKNQASNMWTAGVFARSGVFSCFRCGTQQRWHQLTHHIQTHGPFNRYSDSPSAILDWSGSLQSQIHRESHSEMRWHSWNDPFPDEFSDSIIEDCSAAVSIDAAAVDRISNSLIEPKNRCLTNRLIKKRGISLPTLQLYKVGFAEYDFLEHLPEQRTAIVRRKSMMFPQSRIVHSPRLSTEVSRYKVRRVQHKSFCQWPRDGGEGLFGLHTLLDPEQGLLSDCLLLCEGELDALSVYQGTHSEKKSGITAVSTANGANLPAPEMLTAVARLFSKVVIFADWDEKGESFARKLRVELEMHGLNVAVVTKERYQQQLEDRDVSELESCKDANDLLRAGIDLNLLRDFERWVD